MLQRDPDNANVLVLTNVTLDDEGWYTCIAANGLGQAFESAYLKVLEEWPVHAEPIKTHPIWIITLVIILGISLTCGIGMVGFFLKSRTENSMKHKAMETVNMWTKKVVVLKPNNQNAVADSFVSVLSPPQSL